MPEQRPRRILAHGDESTNRGRKGLDDAATQLPASHGAIARGWFNCALSSLLLCRLLSKTDQTSIVTTKQRQAAVEFFRGIDFDKNAILSQEVSPLAKRLTISLR
jgi:hypothetical protein